MQKRITKTLFEKEVLQSRRPVLVRFWAPWSGPCQILAPVVEEIKEQYRNTVAVTDINVDENNELARKYSVLSIPTLKFFKQGKVVDEIIGVAPRQLIDAHVQRLTKG